MTYNEDLQQYCYEYEDIIFVWDEEPDEQFMDTVKMLSDNYHEHLDEIIQFMMPDLEEMYGNLSVEDIKSNLGKPFIDYDNGSVIYCDQTFDHCHIFEFEFLDDNFEELQYFSVNG